MNGMDVASSTLVEDLFWRSRPALSCNAWLFWANSSQLHCVAQEAAPETLPSTKGRLDKDAIAIGLDEAIRMQNQMILQILHICPLISLSDVCLGPCAPCKAVQPQRTS